MKRQRDVAVSKLAAYAADPETYVELEGRLGTEESRLYGDAHHRNLAKQNMIPRLVVATILALCVLAAWWWTR